MKDGNIPRLLIPIMAALCRFEHGVLAGKMDFKLIKTSTHLNSCECILVPKSIDGCHAMSTLSRSLLPRCPVCVAVFCCKMSFSIFDSVIFGSLLCWLGYPHTAISYAVPARGPYPFTRLCHVVAPYHESCVRGIACKKVFRHLNSFSLC